MYISWTIKVRGWVKVRVRVQLLPIDPNPNPNPKPNCPLSMKVPRPFFFNDL